MFGLAKITQDPRGEPKSSVPFEKTAPPCGTKIVQQEPAVKSETQGVVGAGKKRSNTYALFVKEIMEKHKMKLHEASQYIKENVIYKNIII